MILSHDGDRFICAVTFHERHIPKQAGFHWDITRKVWYTTNYRRAKSLEQYADSSVRSEFNRVSVIPATPPNHLIGPKDLSLYQYQKDAVWWSLSRNNSYIAADPGLGKTPIAATIILNAGYPAVYVCPPFLRRNVEAELAKWCPGHKVLIVSDTRAHRTDIEKEVDDFALGKGARGKGTLIIDEAHRFKSSNTKRSLAIYGMLPQFSKRVFLSGTPMPNRPLELYPVLKHAAWDTIGYAMLHEFGLKYCAGWFGTYGWDYQGASNVEELGQAIRKSFMLRIKKADVLKELPPKIEEEFFIGDDLPKDLQALEARLEREFTPEELAEEIAPNKHVATYRKELGKLKVKESAEYLNYLLEETDEKIIVFAIHKDTIAGLAAALHAHSPLIVTGQTPVDDRHNIVTDFQTNPKRRVIVGNVQALGVGFNMTVASRVFFVEFSWCPSDNVQASDRAHRIGQTESVFVQYAVFKNSLDRSIRGTIARKQTSIDLI